jgi:hypothetical protein
MVGLIFWVGHFCAVIFEMIEDPCSKTSASSVESLRGKRSLLQFNMIEIAVWMSENLALKTYHI